MKKFLNLEMKLKQYDGKFTIKVQNLISTYEDNRMRYCGENGLDSITTEHRMVEAKLKSKIENEIPSHSRIFVNVEKMLDSIPQKPEY